jgi:glyoxylase-like metal-dependent hydrolase (beta-lactamase superfamily II)
LPFKGISPKLHPIKELKNSRVIEIAPDVWEIEGYISTQFFIKPASSNIFIFRDNDDVLLLDTGLYPYYRKLILDILVKYRKEGAKNLTLLLSQGHFDHAANDDIILEAGYDNIRFLLPEMELETIDLLNHFTGDFRELEKYYNPYSMLPFLVNLASKISIKFARSLVKKVSKMLFQGINTLVDKAELLLEESKVTKSIGNIEFTGWEIGRFFAIHDGTHSPGHISLYDPKNKLIMTGDATIEINPPFFNSRLIKSIDVMKKFRQIAEQGYVQIAIDSHHSSKYFKKILKKFNVEPLDSIQIADYARGKEQCISFFSMFENYYKELKNEVLSALSLLKEATIPEIMKEFKRSDNKAVKMKIAMKFPKFPSRLDVLIAVVLDELKTPWRREGKKVIFESNRN